MKHATLRGRIHSVNEHIDDLKLGIRDAYPLYDEHCWSKHNAISILQSPVSFATIHFKLNIYETMQQEGRLFEY